MSPLSISDLTLQHYAPGIRAERILFLLFVEEPMPTIESSPDFVANAYQKIAANLLVVRKRLGRPLTYAEKVLLGHLDNAEKA